MRIPNSRRLILLGLCFLAGLAGCSRRSAAERSAEPEPTARPQVRLAVLIVVDQLRADLLTRFETLFGKEGFRRLAEKGASFSDCRYPYSGTWTGAGHASLATGVTPDKHGLIGNEWFDRKLRNYVACVEDETARQVPEGDERVAGASPRRLLSPTVGDKLKPATRGKGKVVALSLKDRAVVPLGGQRPDACYWLDDVSGGFITSSWYCERVHPWVDEFNRARPMNRWLDKSWEKLLADVDYDKHATVDDTEGESHGLARTRTFPHPFAERASLTHNRVVEASPFGNTLLRELAEKAIVAEELGKDDIPDLLMLSFSSNDMVGHGWGPDSHEVMDITLRTDREIAALLKFLDKIVGEGKYAVVLTSDHGVCPLPEVSRSRKKPAARISSLAFRRLACDSLEEKYGESRLLPIEAIVNNELYISRTWLRDKELTLAAVEKTLATWARKQDEVEAVVTRSQLQADDKDPMVQLVKRSFHDERSGDMTIVLKPLHFFRDPLSPGTTHGSSHDYDRHVPLLIFGPGVQAGAKRESVTPLAAAPVLAYFLGIQDRTAETKVPIDLFAK